ncbi:restriction endonuclease [Streptomyces glomeratus]|uniref:Restriction endonuclease n=1 Tax=Streptomyces glomeratus TaxID=284452 RepID=A0ABP6LZK6_9ACTN|nr:restriction endonuclease [Streptomyces glomeratus]
MFYVLVAIWGVGVPLAILLQLVKHEPALGIPLLLAAFAASGAYVVRRARKAEQRRLDAARLAQIRDVQSREVARYHTMSPNEFEHAIAYLCRRDGCTDVRVVGGAGDLGADVIATAPTGHRIVIQCKRYGLTNKVGSPDAQRFGGTCYSVHGAHIAVMVTTSTFTRQAIGYANAQRIRLYDEHALAGWASQTGPAPWHQASVPAA